MHSLRSLDVRFRGLDFSAHFHPFTAPNVWGFGLFLADFRPLLQSAELLSRFFCSIDRGEIFMEIRMGIEEESLAETIVVPKSWSTT